MVEKLGGDDEDREADVVASEEPVPREQERLGRHRALERDGELVRLIRTAGWMSEAYKQFAVALDELLVGALTHERKRSTLHLTVATVHGVRLGTPRATAGVLKKLIVDASALTVCHFARVHLVDGLWTPQGESLLIEDALEIGLLMYAGRYLSALALGGVAPPVSIDPLDDQIDAQLYLLLRPEPDWDPLW